MGLDFKAAKRAAVAQLPSLLPRLLPRGKIKGDWYVACVPWRKDRTPSLGVSLTSGAWKDFGRPGDGGDVLDLIARLERRPIADVVRSLCP